MSGAPYPHYHHQAIKKMDALSTQIIRAAMQSNISTFKDKNMPEGQYRWRSNASPVSDSYMPTVKKILEDDSFTVSAQEYPDVLEAANMHGDTVHVRASNAGFIAVTYTLGKRPNASMLQRLTNPVRKYPATTTSVVLWTFCLSLFAQTKVEDWKYEFFVLAVVGLTTSIVPLLTMLWEERRYGRKNPGYHPMTYRLYPVTFYVRAIQLYVVLGLALGIPDYVIHGLDNAIPYAAVMGLFVAPVSAAFVLPLVGGIVALVLLPFLPKRKSAY